MIKVLTIKTHEDHEEKQHLEGDTPNCSSGCYSCTDGNGNYQLHGEWTTLLGGKKKGSPSGFPFLYSAYLENSDSGWGDSGSGESEVVAEAFCCFMDSAYARMFSIISMLLSFTKMMLDTRH